MLGMGIEQRPIRIILGCMRAAGMGSKDQMERGSLPRLGIAQLADRRLLKCGLSALEREPTPATVEAGKPPQREKFENLIR